VQRNKNGSGGERPRERRATGHSPSESGTDNDRHNNIQSRKIAECPAAGEPQSKQPIEEHDDGPRAFLGYGEIILDTEDRIHF
jgi:hypothetical protein